MKKELSDPIERIVAGALDAAGIAWVSDEDPRAAWLDFYLPNFDVHIEVKQMHSARIAVQMERVPNIIVIQGRGAAIAFAQMLASSMAQRPAI